MKKMVLLLGLLLMVFSMVSYAVAITYLPYKGIDYTIMGLSAERVAVLDKARRMAMIMWTPKESFPTWQGENGKYNPVKALDGTVTNKFIAGKTYAGIPYSMDNRGHDEVAWQKFVDAGNTTSIMMTSKYGGRNATTAYGVDCSAFVCLALREVPGYSKLDLMGTATMISSPLFIRLNSINDMLPGDLFLVHIENVHEHVMMYVGKKDNLYYVFESTVDGSRCQYRGYTEAGLSSYKYYRFKGFKNDAKYYPYDVNGYVDGKKVGTLNGLAKFDVDINSARVGSQVVDFYRDCQDGSTYSVSNVKAADGYEYLGPSTAGSGLSGKISGAAVETILMFKRKNYVFDLNGIVDDAEVRTLEGVGTVDIYMNGKLVADDVSDYTKEWPYGTEYEITDFKAKSGYAYTNTYKKGGGMKGRIGAGTMEVFPWFVSEGKAMSTGYDRVLPDGDYIVRNAADMGKTYYLDVPGIEWPAPEGTEVSLYMKENGVKVYRHDVWTLKYEGGYYTVTQAGTDMALSAVNRRHGAGIQLGSKDAAARWAIQYSAADGAYVMQSSQSGYYLDVAGELAVGASVQQSKDAGTRSGWLMIPYEPVAAVAEGRYVLVSDADGAQVADIEGDSYEIGNGVNVLPGPAEGQNRYNAFDVTPLREGFYTLRQAGSGKALEVAYGAEGAGKNVQVGTYSAGYHQQWALLPQGDGYALVSRASGFAMAIDGENIVQSRRSGEAGQRWQLAPVHAVRYDANGGFGAPKDQEAYYHNALTVSKLEPTRLGWVFTGWATSPDAAKAEYLPGRDYSIETDLKLYAVWKQAQRVELPDDLEAVERRSFAGTSAQEIVIPQGCKSIASQAFAESGSLIAVVIPDSVTDIADDAFQGSANVVLYAHSGAYAQQYALMYGIAFAAVGE